MEKEDLIQLFSDSSEQHGKTYEQRCIFDSNFDTLAQIIIDELQQVSPSVALEEGSDKGYFAESGDTEVIILADNLYDAFELLKSKGLVNYTITAGCRDVIK